MQAWLLYSLLCLILWGLWGFALKIAYQNLSWTQTYFLSSLASFTFMLIVILFYRMKLPPIGAASIAAILAGLFGGAGYLFFVKALEQGKASIVIPLTALYPAITVIIALIVLREKISIYQGLGILLAIIASFLLSMK